MGTAANLTADLVADTQGLVILRWDGDPGGIYNISQNGRLVRRVRGTHATVAVGLGERCTFEVSPADADQDEQANISSEIPPVHGILEWHVSSSTTASRFRVYWDEGDGGGTDVLLDEIVYTGQWTISVETPPLDSGVEYNFSIVSVDDAGNESSGATVSLRLRTLPRAPSGLGIVLDGETGRARISWT